MKTINTQLARSITYLQQIISNGGPEAKEYESLNKVFDTICYEYKLGKITSNELELLQAGFGDECLENTLHGHIRTKPFGYAGDFLIIDKIYREQVTTDMRFQKWDTFWNNHAAAKAVRNRKDYFIQTMTSRVQPDKTTSLLNVASGPARDIAELYNQITPQNLKTVCVEADNNAIGYAKDLNKKNEEQVSFIHKNIFRFTTEEQFDIIWSAGLFDYFDDKTFVRLLKKFMQWTKPGSEIIIGNFGLQNPSRNYMELIGDWHLQHRQEAKLTNMAIEAGAKEGNIYVGKEPEGVNLFLHIIM